MASWLGLSSLAFAPRAAVDRVFATLPIAARPASVEPAPEPSERACHG